MRSRKYQYSGALTECPRSSPPDSLAHGALREEGDSVGENVESGFLWQVTRSTLITLGGLGGELVAVGSGSLLATEYLRTAVWNAVEMATVPSGIPVDVGIAVVNRIFGTFDNQSIFLAALGIILISLAIYIHIQDKTEPSA